MRVFLFAILVVVLYHWWDIIALLPANMQSAFGLGLVLACLFGGFGSFSD
jgi:hypothetical protein